MHTFENHSHLGLHKSINDKMSKLYIYQAMLTFAKSMIGIFVPVYLFKLGYSLIDIIIYSLGHSLVYLIMVPFSIGLIQKIGFKYTILLSTPLYIIQIVCLNYLGYSNFFFHLSWLTFGIYSAIFWPAMHSEFVSNGSSKHRGSQLGTLQVITTIVASIAPFIGGIFLETLTYWYLILFVSFIILIGTVPLLLSKDLPVDKYEFKFKDYIRLIKNKKLKNSKIAFSSEGIEWILNVTIWPIIVFILLSQNFIKFGILFTVVSMVSVFFVLYFKKLIDGKDRHKYLNIITRLLSLNWMLKTVVLFFGSVFLYFVESMSKLILNLFGISFMSIFYNNASKVGFMDYIILRELYLHSTKIFVGLFVFIPFLAIFGQSIVVISCLGVFGIFFSLGLSYIREE